jgi:anti-anti-sigma factor
MTDVLDDRWVQLLLDDFDPSTPITRRTRRIRIGQTRDDVLAVEVSLGAHTVVRVHGDIDASTADQLEREITLALDGADDVSLDLGSVAFCDSRGVRAITNLIAEAARVRVDLRIVRASAPVRQVFELVGMRSTLP